jgi:hypothetical protein
MIDRFKRLLAGPALLAFLLTGCATSHVIEWSKGEKSAFNQPNVRQAIFVHTGGTLLALPVAVVWDVVTFPFQILWNVHPYGDVETPEEVGDR